MFTAIPAKPAHQLKFPLSNKHETSHQLDVVRLGIFDIGRSASSRPFLRSGRVHIFIRTVHLGFESYTFFAMECLVVVLLYPPRRD